LQPETLMSTNLQRWPHENPRQIHRFARVVVQS
jgi:hypothetical protein